MGQHGRVLALALVASLSVGSPANADDPNVDTNDRGFGIQAERRSQRNDDISDSLGVYNEKILCGPKAGPAECRGDLECPPGESQMYGWYTDPGTGEAIPGSGRIYCSGGGSAGPSLGMVATAFRRIPLPESPLIIQPPKGKTLINFDTNFYTKDRTLNRSVRLLGHRVDLRIEVYAWQWHFDDGDTMETDTPGAPYPNLVITHDYAEAAHYKPRLDTVWIADYRVDGGAWATVPGSVTITGTPEPLEAVEARPVLVG